MQMNCETNKKDKYINTEGRLAQVQRNVNFSQKISWRGILNEVEEMNVNNFQSYIIVKESTKKLWIGVYITIL